MTDLEKVRAALGECTACPSCADSVGPALLILDGMLAKPVMRQWGLQYNDGQHTCIGDTTIYPFPESQAKAIAAGDSRRKVYTRTAAHQVPAGPWEREV